MLYRKISKIASDDLFLYYFLAIFFFYNNIYSCIEDLTYMCVLRVDFLFILTELRYIAVLRYIPYIYI